MGQGAERNGAHTKTHVHSCGADQLRVRYVNVGPALLCGLHDRGDDFAGIGNHGRDNEGDVKRGHARLCGDLREDVHHRVGEHGAQHDT